MVTSFCWASAAPATSASDAAMAARCLVLMTASLIIPMTDDAGSPAFAGTTCNLDRRERPAQDVHDAIDMLFLRDERRGDERRIAGRLEVQAVVEQLLLERVAPAAGRAVRGEVDRAEHPVAAR